ncbi:MAG: NAD(P)H-dependent oxidoreductase [Spirochaetaceae bacterium]
MNVLIIYTHPNRKSLNGGFLEKTVEGLKLNSSVQNIEVLDLYQENFNPALIFNEDKRRRDMFKDPLLNRYRDQITKSDKIVFIYPIWWGRPPAMLLGFFDQLFATNFAYKYEKGQIMPTGLLKGKKVICISTMKGPAGYLRLLYGNVHQVLMKKVLLSFVGIKKVRFLEFGNMEANNGKQELYLEKTKNIMAKL